MIYNRMEKAIFKSRPNRFIAYVETSRGIEICHVKNTGRCKELLVENAQIYVQRNNNENRKTKLDLITVKKGDYLINMDSQAPNQAVKDWLTKGEVFSKKAQVYPEKTFGKSRFDFYIEDGSRKIFMEVKGVTLEENGVVSFPDAPTLRGLKHVEELEEAIKQGYEAYILFVIQLSPVEYLHPNDVTQPEFGRALCHAKKKGVNIMAYDCLVTKNSMEINHTVEVRLNC